MVAYLQKPEGSEEFHQIVDFLNTSHIRYALTKNPTIYVSLIQQFWQTATTRTLDNGEIEITATIDGKVKGQFFQGKGSTVPVESHHTPTCAPSTSPPYLLSPPRSSIRQETKVPQPSSPTHTHVADEAASTRQGSGNIDKTSYIPHDSPLPRVNTLRSNEGKMQHNELMDLVTTLSDRVYGAVYTKLIMKVKKLKKTVKTSKARRKANIVVSDKEVDLEDPSKQGRNKGKGIMEESESDVVKTKRQQEQERLGLEAAVRLQEEFDKEERQRIARVHEAAQTFSEEEWENIRARVEADKELNQRLQVEERNKYSEVNQEKMLVDLINQRKRYFAKQKAEAKRKNPMTQAQ
nr:hypothetical protein [Tanacetum cinerariifolium]